MNRTHVARWAFSAAWIGGQLALVATGGLRADGAFGFRMFPESTTIAIHLDREVGCKRTIAPVVAGEWTAKSEHGIERRFAWTDRVDDPVLSHLDVTMHAAYGKAAQLARLQAALDDVATHDPDDAETCRFVATVTVRRNGGEPETITLWSEERLGCGWNP